jgi:hypothetical protein
VPVDHPDPAVHGAHRTLVTQADGDGAGDPHAAEARSGRISTPLSAEFVPEDVGARVGGHLVDFDGGASGIERDPADFDHRVPAGIYRRPTSDGSGIRERRSSRNRAGAWPRSDRRA